MSLVGMSARPKESNMQEIINGVCESETPRTFTEPPARFPLNSLLLLPLLWLDKARRIGVTHLHTALLVRFAQSRAAAHFSDIKTIDPPLCVPDDSSCSTLYPLNA